MTQQRLWEVALATTVEAEEPVAELLQRVFGAPASSYLNLDAGTLRVSSYVSFDPSKEPAKIAGLKSGLDCLRRLGLKIGLGRVSSRPVPRENWAESWKRHFRPLEIGRDLLIKPNWSKRRPKPGQAVVTINPGLSFGTGQHPTTAFCLRQLAENRITNQRQSMLDIGTGSGILAIAAAKLGYAPVHAFDNDVVSIRVAKANARANQVAGKIRISAGDVTRMPRPARPYVVVCANLVSSLLIQENARIIARVAKGGLLILAGILHREFKGVRKVYQASGLRLVASRTENEWRCGTFLRS